MKGRYADHADLALAHELEVLERRACLHDQNAERVFGIDLQLADFLTHPNTLKAHDAPGAIPLRAKPAFPERSTSAEFAMGDGTSRKTVRPGST